MTDLTQPSAKVVLDQINVDNELQLALAQVTFGVPVANTDSTLRNTDIPVLAVAGQGYVGSRSINLDRLSGSVLFLNYIPQLAVDNPDTTKDLLTSLNQLHGLDITLADIVDHPIDTGYVDAQGVQLHDITFHNSLVYLDHITVNILGIPDNTFVTESGIPLVSESGLYLIADIL